jgi:hypothetical protein
MSAGNDDFRLFRYDGYVEIERNEGGEPMQFPFSIEAPQEMSPAEIEALANDQTEGFLMMLQDTAPSHAEDYGDIIQVVITSVTSEEF